MYRSDLIKKPRMADDQDRYPNGVTKDIIETVLYADSKSAWYTEAFAKTLKGKSLIDTCKNVWGFVKTMIPYKLDPSGQQWIKSPGRLWAEKAGDCKSFSVFTASCLQNLAIPYGFRFASYSKSDPTPTHVYVFIPAQGKRSEIILDSVWTGPFDTQKKFEHKQDHIMSRIAYLGATTSPMANHKAGELTLTKDISEYSDGEMDLLLARQRLEIEKMNSAHVGGPDNYKMAGYDRALATVNAALANINNPAAIHGIGCNMDNNGNAAVGNIFKKIGKGIAKGVKAVTKVVTLPLKIIAKGIMEIYLPKAAPMFLYLFADEKNLTDKMKAKRKKAQKFKDFVCNKIGMKDKHFMAIVRNKLTKNYKMSPEAFLSKAIKGSVALNGIGAIGKPAAKAKINKQKKKPVYMPTKVTSASVRTAAPVNVTSSFAAQARQAAQNQPAPQSQSGGGLIQDTADKLASGNLIGAVIGAIGWIIQKLGGKKEDALTANDIPNIADDLGNAYNEGSLKQNYNNLQPDQKEQLKETVTDLISENATPAQAEAVIMQKFGGSLTQAQTKEMVYESQTGFDAPSDGEAADMARGIKTANDGADPITMEKTGGGTGGGVCKC